MSKQAIGIFDSGVGGISIWREINALLPTEDTIYLADSRNAPYGPKGKERIIELAVKNTELLLQKNCKLVVVACNTATTNAIETLRSTYDIPFIGIEPAIKPAALNSKTKAVGILATKGTLSSALFFKTSHIFASDIKVIEQDGDGIVNLIESGRLFSEEMRALLKSYLEPMIKANIDYLVLGCTHYPFLMPLLIELLPKHVKIIDSGEAVARQTNAVLKHNDLLNTSAKKGVSEFFTNGNPEVMRSILNDPKLKVNYQDF
ncbi:MAG: glutamate racemase [Bacteroidia bacterium]|nr:glutamate racemase [Bacteroidia bacterium]NND24388.1 glutamate racemase [Flavobacteriaceae bacterium]MBT8279788.1 glutamate racemase [Bacteroidia bacterium]NNK59869.1 glutamate racemase [Flavobacteriaceae bacterium]NNL31756.1 glutamate racemase [Flavobacteriaceae bacterium]